MNLRESILKKRKASSHISDLILIFKCLYPHEWIVNHFEEQINKNSQFTARQKQLLNELIIVSVLLNKSYRPWDKFMHLHAIEEDYINALNLMQRELNVKQPMLLLNSASRRFLVEIMDKCQGDTFKFSQAQQITHLSRTNVWWKIKELESKDFIKCIGGSKSKGYLYQLTDKCFPT